MARGSPKALKEFELIAALRAATPKAGRGVRLGIGDDAAVVTLRESAALSVDACVENVHFRLDLMSAADVGYRAVSAAVSDLAAMGARPRYCLSAWTLPRRLSRAAQRGLIRGQREALDEFGLELVGGNISGAKLLSITTTVIGEVKRPLTRDGARPGDQVWLVGELGLGRAGLEWLSTERRPRAVARAATRRAVEAYRRPRALTLAGARLVGRASAAIDVSDGLAGDAAHLARASGVRVVFDERLLALRVTPELQTLAGAFGVPPLTWLLAGGEDFALLATGQSRHRPRFARVIGRIEDGVGVELENADGRQRLGSGYEHSF